MSQGSCDYACDETGINKICLRTSLRTAVIHLCAPKWKE